MKAHNAFLLVVFLSFLATGCADMSRSAFVETPRIEIISSQSNGLTSAVAGDLFRDVAKKLKFVVDPVQDEHDFILYSAHAPETNPTNRTFLALWIDNKRVLFQSNIYGTLQDFAAATNASSLFQQELDKRGIQYKVSTRKKLYQDGLF
ncbi:MAG TPA: hypothetical protein VHG71_12155 [Verrucomicrobiae bacterium]|nr:hypothetical protein [Verrucomicrobiae bacterium]